MAARMEFDPSAKTGRSEEKTNDLKFIRGRLHQKFNVMVLEVGKPMQVSVEWREVPSDDPPPPEAA
jgi:hypothetical protein